MRSVTNFTRVKTSEAVLPLCLAAFALTPGTGGGCPSPVLWEGVCIGSTPTIRISRSAGTEEDLEIGGFSGRLTAIRRYLSLNVTDLARVLLVERPTVYAWLADRATPQQENQVRVDKVYSLARHWRSLSAHPMGSMAREIVGGTSILELLSQSALDEKLIWDKMAKLNSAVKSRATIRQERSVARLAELHGFKPKTKEEQDASLEDSGIL